MRCRYCYLRGVEREKEVVDLKFAKRAISDFFFENPHPAIRFFADGEPTIEIQKIKDLCDYACSISEKRPLFELQTNGVFDENVANWIGDNIDIIFISMDGPPRINDLNRVDFMFSPTSEIVEKNIEILLKKKCEVGIRATITKFNVKNQVEMIEYYKSFGIKMIFGDMVFAKIGGDADGFGVDYITFVDEYVRARDYAESVEIFYGTMFSSNFDEKVKYACRSCLPTPHVTTDGYISCCDMCVSGNSELKELIYGKYDEESDVILYNELAMNKIRLRSVENIPACKLCIVKDYCAGACLGEALNETGDFFGVKSESCKAICYLWEKLGGGEIKNKYLHP
jgi:hypothetical protein